jgi:hypothetical protein
MSQNQSPAPPKGSIHLPHGAWLLKEERLVCVPAGGMTVLNFALEEISQFADILDDICTVIESNINLDVHVCPTCGNEVEDIEYDEPKDDEWQ